MSWYDPTSWDWGGALGIGSGDPGNKYRDALQQNAQQQGQFGQNLQGQYLQNQAGMNNTMGMLQGLANGQNSVSAEQLRQGLQQAQAQQMSMAASAAPQNQAMAARNAMVNSGNVASGMMGQQAMAGLQERQAALNALSQMQLGQSGQNLQGALGMAQNANNAYGTNLGNPQKTWGGMIGGLGAAAIAKSDRSAKTDIKDGSGDASKALDKLRGYSYRYKDERDGKGKQFGILAQEMESAGLGHAVIDTPTGKVVHGAKAATAALGLAAELHRRVKKLEER